MAGTFSNLTVAELDAAISAVSLAQKYTRPDGTVIERANLGELVALRDKLVQEASANTGGGLNFVRMGFGRPS